MPGGSPRNGGARALPGGSVAIVVKSPFLDDAHDGVAASVGDDVAAPLLEDPDRVAVDVGSVRVGVHFVRHDVGDHGDALAVQLPGDERRQQLAVFTEPLEELVAATETDAQHELVLAVEDEVRGPEGLAVRVDDRRQAFDDPLVPPSVADPGHGAGEPEAEQTQARVLNARRGSTAAGLGDVQISTRGERKVPRIVQP